MPEETKEQKMSRALAVWAMRNNIRPIDFQQDMDWSYNYSWRVLRGKDVFREAAWGKFITVYGLDSLTELFHIAGINPNELPS